MSSAFEVLVRSIDPAGEYEEYYADKHDRNYFAVLKNTADRRILEARLRTGTDVFPYIIGIPVPLLEHPERPHRITVLFDGMHFQLFDGGVLLDEEMPEGSTQDMSFYGDGMSVSPAVKNLLFSRDLDNLVREEIETSVDENIQYYTPENYNTWIGDVTAGFFEGRFYIFYLHDRRHHASRRHKGAHHWNFLTSCDLVNWIDHGPVFDLDAQWQSVGTGNPFVLNGKLHLAFGWHTGRVVPLEKTRRKYFLETAEKTNRVQAVSEAKILKSGLYPIGASYAASDDGIHFRKSGIDFHFCENPCVIPQADGTIRLIGDGSWISRSGTLDDWERTTAEFPPEGPKSAVRNTMECPCFFEWNGYEYLLMGFCGAWNREKGRNEWRDFAAEDAGPYDGIAVPMVAPFTGNRRLIAGWLGGNGWGSCLVVRELLDEGGGILGTRWIPEQEFRMSEKRPYEPGSILPESELIELDMLLCGDASLRFEGDGASSCECRISGGRISIFRSGEEPAPLLSEIAGTHPECSWCHQFARVHFQSRDFTLRGESPKHLRLRIVRRPKLDTTILDFEFDGKRTMISHRSDLIVHSVLFNRAIFCNLQEVQ